MQIKAIVIIAVWLVLLLAERNIYWRRRSYFEHAVNSIRWLVASRAGGLVLLGFWLAACTAAQLEAIDPVTYVKDTYCPDAQGRSGKEYPWTRLVAGNTCCSWQGMGNGQCAESESCMNTEDCSTPLPANDVGATRPHKRTGLR